MIFVDANSQFLCSDIITIFCPGQGKGLSSSPIIRAQDVGHSQDPEPRAATDLHETVQADAARCP